MSSHGAIRAISRDLTLSAVHRGVEYEKLSMRILQNHLSMSLRRTGGKADGGVDLQGWWWLPADEVTPHNHLNGHKRFRILAQCKRETKKIAPKYVRELEGVLYRHGIMQEDPKLHPTIGMLISTSPFSKAATLHAHTSPLPLFLLHLPIPETSLPDVSPEDNTQFTAGSAMFNPALAGHNGLLHGCCEARWEHAVGPSSPGRLGLWWKGQKMQSWTPDVDDDVAL